MKLIALDIDGTLLNDDRMITPFTKKALKEVREAGHKVVIASGRDYAGTTVFAEDLEFDRYGGLLSNFNGARITNYKNKKVIVNHTLDLDLTKEILSYADELGMDFMIYYGGKIYTNNMDTYYLDFTAKLNDMEIVYNPKLIDEMDFSPNNILMSKQPDKIIEPSRLIYEKYGDLTTQVRSTPWYYEIMPKNVSKGTSLIDIADYYGIDHKDIIAFGDEMNDYSMIEMAGVGVAMANAVDTIKEIADYITLSNNDDGIADYIYKFILN